MWYKAMSNTHERHIPCLFGQSLRTLIQFLDFYNGHLFEVGAYCIFTISSHIVPVRLWLFRHKRRKNITVTLYQVFTISFFSSFFLWGGGLIHGSHLLTFLAIRVGGHSNKSSNCVWRSRTYTINNFAVVCGIKLDANRFWAIFVWLTSW